MMSSTLAMEMAALEISLGEQAILLQYYKMRAMDEVTDRPLTPATSHQVHQGDWRARRPPP
jgi:hypothetical protein